MLLHCCAVFDSAVGAFGRPFFAPARQAAIRSFIDEVSRVADDNPLNKHPSDYELFFLFGLDDNTGLVTNNAPEVLLRGKDVPNAPQ